MIYRFVDRAPTNGAGCEHREWQFRLGTPGNWSNYKAVIIEAKADDNATLVDLILDLKRDDIVHVSGPTLPDAVAHWRMIHAMLTLVSRKRAGATFPGMENTKIWDDTWT